MSEWNYFQVPQKCWFFCDWENEKMLTFTVWPQPRALKKWKEWRLQNILWGNFPSGSVVENPPANAGDTSSILGSGRFHMLQSNYACALQQERPLQWEACALQLDSSLQLPQLEKATCSNEDSTQPKIHTYIYIYMYIYTISHEAPYTGTCLACMRC